MDLANKIAALKEKLCTAKQFSEIWDFFFDIAEEEPFLKCGELITQRHELLEVIIGQIAAQIFPGSHVALLGMHLIRLKEYNFIHGGCTLNGRVGTVMYFEEDDFGCFGVVLPDNRTQFARFSAKTFRKPEHKPSMN